MGTPCAGKWPVYRSVFPNTCLGVHGSVSGGLFPLGASIGSKGDSVNITTKIGQHFVCGFPGTSMDAAFIEAVRTHKIANVILFGRNIESKEQVRRLCADIQALVRAECGTDAIIGIDQEGGMSTRLSEDCTNTPTAMALSATGESSSAYEAGAITGTELKALGINCNFSPVLDVNSNRDNPVIGVRSYGDTKERVIEHALAMAEGLQSKGILAVGKHFPGHGDTHLDSHLTLPKVLSDSDELQEHIAPFRAAINNGIQGIMSSHILFPSLEKKEVPATMSRAILTGFLKDELLFKGLVFTDCMEMQAIGRYYGTVKASLAALQAGADMVLISHHVSLACKAVDLVGQALEQGLLNEEEFFASTDKILLAKEMLAEQESIDFSVVGSLEHRERVQELVQKSICLVNDRGFSLGDRPLFVAPRLFSATHVSKPQYILSFAPEMEKRLQGGSIVISDNPLEEEIEEAIKQARFYTSVVVGTSNGHLLGGQLALVKRLALLGIPICCVALKNPYDLSSLPHSVQGYAAFAYRRDVFDALAKVLTGKLVPTGEMPVEL